MLCIGYAGIDSFDTILYTGRTLTKLNYRLLIVDLSGTGAMKRAIKHGMEIDSSEEIVNYRDINYLRRMPTDIELCRFQNGVVFVVYGMNYNSGFPLTCFKTYITINTLPHMVETIGDLIKIIIKQEGKISLLIRDIVSIDDVDSVKQSISLTPAFCKASYLFLDLDDYQNAIECQKSQVIKFTKVSSHMERYVISQVKDILPEVKASQIKRAVRMAKRGD